MPAGYPSGTNTYVPNHAASNGLIVGFSRSPDTFPVSDYTQYVNAKNNVGLYFVWTSREGARVLTGMDDDDDWAEGNPAPVGINHTESGAWQSFITQRKCYAFTLGQMTVDQATYPILAAHSAVAAQRAMTARTLRVFTSLHNASWGNNAIIVDNGALGSGKNWSNGSNGTGSENPPHIKKTLQTGEILIHKATLGTVPPRQQSLVTNPVTCQAMAASPEINDYVKQSPFALAQIRGDVPNQNGRWGMPTVIYNHPFVIEDAVRVSSRKAASSDTIGYVFSDSEAFLLCRQGDLEGLEGSPTYSTVQVFFYIDELTVESKYDADNRRYLGRVISNYQPVTVSTYAGVKYTKCIG